MMVRNFMFGVKIKLTKVTEGDIDKYDAETLKKFIMELLMFNVLYRVYNLNFDVFSQKAFKQSVYGYARFYGMTNVMAVEQVKIALNDITKTYTMNREEANEYYSNTYPHMQLSKHYLINN